MKNLIGKKVEKEVPFCGETVTIKKLSVSEVYEVQRLVTPPEPVKGSKTPVEPMDPMKIVNGILRIGVNDAENLTDEEFAGFPLDELNDLASQVMAYCGLAIDNESTDGVDTEGN